MGSRTASADLVEIGLVLYLLPAGQVPKGKILNSDGDRVYGEMPLARRSVQPREQRRSRLPCGVVA